MASVSQGDGERLLLEETVWRGRQAWRIAGPALELVVMRLGAHIAAIRGPGDDLNPLWQPPWPADSPEEGPRHPELYGEGPEAALLAVIVGHNLCLDRFGSPHPGEERPLHGEAGVVEWRLADDGGAAGGEQSAIAAGHPNSGVRRAVTLVAELPRARLTLSRQFTITADTATVTTRVRHDDREPRAIEWAEHVSLGDPFIDGARFEAAADGAWIAGVEPQPTRRFPDVEPEGEVDVTRALAMPTASEERPFGDIVTARLTAGCYRVEHPDLGWALEYRFDNAEFPWLCLWTQHRSRTGPPWNGVTRARGMEFSTKPFPEGKPLASRAERFHGRPTTCIVPPGDGLERSFSVRWARTRDSES